MRRRTRLPPQRPRRPGGGSRAWARRLVGVLGSYTLAVTLLLLLLVLTAVGTFAQAHMSLYDVQRRYFDSLVAVIDVGPISIPLPGGALTIALLSLNLIVGGVIRLRRGSSHHRASSSRTWACCCSSPAGSSRRWPPTRAR